MDLNNDGVTDLTFSVRTIAYATRLLAYAEGQNRFMSAAYHPSSVLPWGKRIGPKASWGASGIFLAGAGHHFGSCVSYKGNWTGKRGVYLGVQFSIGSEIHYGWARLSISGPCIGGPNQLTGYAYETIPNKPIIAGKTSGFTAADIRYRDLLPAPSQQRSLGMLALGTDGLNIWRREEEV